jgi:uncharacterized membrane protein YhiD involved in acid resistance
MDTMWILIILGIIAGIALIGFLVKSFVKIVLILGLIYLLFQLGFIWGVDDLNEKLHLDKFLKPEVTEQIQEKYDQFSQKRDETGVLDTELVRKTINDTIQVALTEASDEIRNVDKEKLIEDLSIKLQNFDTEAVAKALDELKAELAKYNVTPEEVQEATVEQTI